MDFCKGSSTLRPIKQPEGMIIPVLVMIYSDRVFTFATKTPSASELPGARRGYAVAARRSRTALKVVGKVITEAGGRDRAGQTGGPEIRRILEEAVRTVMGKARNMGLEVEG